MNADDFHDVAERLCWRILTEDGYSRLDDLLETVGSRVVDQHPIWGSYLDYRFRLRHRELDPYGGMDFAVVGEVSVSLTPEGEPFMWEVPYRREASADGEVPAEEALEAAARAALARAAQGELRRVSCEADARAIEVVFHHVLVDHLVEGDSAVVAFDPAGARVFRCFGWLSTIPAEVVEAPFDLTDSAAIAFARAALPREHPCRESDSAVVAERVFTRDDEQRWVKAWRVTLEKPVLLGERLAFVYLDHEGEIIRSEVQ